MKRKLAVSALCLSLLLVSTARADDAMKDALALVPSEALGFACIPDLRDLDANVQQTLEELGLNVFIPPPMSSLAGVMRMSMQITEGLDERGSLLLVFMPAETPEELEQNMAMLVPSAAPKLLLESMGAEAGEEGTWSLELFGQPAAAVAGKRHVIFASKAEAAQAIATSKESVVKRLSPNELALFEGLKLAAWLDVARAVELYKEQIDAFTGMMLTMQEVASPLGARQSKSSKQQIDTWIDGLRTLMLGLNLGDDGLGFRLGMTSKPGTDLHEMLTVPNTDESLLKGLPKGKYMLALGQIFNPETLDKAFAALDPYFELPPESEGVDQEQLTKLKDLLKGWAKLHTGFRASIEALPPGPGGLIGATFILDTTSSKKWLEDFAQLVETGRSLIGDEEVQQVLKGLSHDPQAETSGDVKIQHLKFDLSTLEEAEEDWMEDLLTIVGKDGLLLRLAAVDDKRVVVAFGGGAKRMTQVIEQARKADAPLDDDRGIKRLAAILPKSRNSVGYIAFDNIVRLVRDITKAVDEEEEFPLEVTEIDAPLAISGRGGEGWSQTDIVIPTELMIWAKDTIFTITGMAGAPVEVTVETEEGAGEGEPTAPEDEPR